MTLLDTWKPVLENGPDVFFSPSGHACAWQPLFREPLMQVIEVGFADGRALFVLEYARPITPCAWVSDDELLYRVWGQPLDDTLSALPPSLRVLCLSSGQSRLLMDVEITMSLTWAGTPDHLSVLCEPNGKPGLFDLDTATGALSRLPAFDTALEKLEVYPLFGHAFCASRREAAVIAWPKGDFLPDGVKPTVANSQWSSILDTPYIQNCVSVQADGTPITQRELTAQAKRQTTPRIFLLDENGGCQEVPGSLKAKRPFWSPDGAWLSFERSEHFDWRSKGSYGSVWAMRRTDLSLMRLGGCGLMNSTVMHPADTLLCQLDTGAIAEADKNPLRAGMRENRWAEFVLRNGEVTHLA